MPQLQIETYVTQYFWLVVFLFSIYYFMASTYMPKIAETLKLRKKLTSSSTSTISSDNELNLTALDSVSRVLSLKQSILKSLSFESAFPSTNNKFFSKI
jgi:hypothetical protein